MHYDAYEKHLFVSLPNEKLVIRIQPSRTSKNAQRDTTADQEHLDGDLHSYAIVAGMVGKGCLGNKKCGDGGMADEALLTYPKVGVAPLDWLLILINNS